VSGQGHRAAASAATWHRRLVERITEQLRGGQLNVVVATDVAASVVWTFRESAM
jgi:superfamily II DNA/RNA helicase